MPCKLLDPSNRNSRGGMIHSQSLGFMRSKGGTWVAYQNHDLGSPNIGHLQFLKVGSDCTFSEPPPHYPGHVYSDSHPYRLVGTVDLATGVINEITASPQTQPAQ